MGIGSAAGSLFVIVIGHDDPRRYGARTSNPWSARALGVRLLLRGVPELPPLSLSLLVPPTLPLLRCSRCRCSRCRCSRCPATPRTSRFQCTLRTSPAARPCERTRRGRASTPTVSNRSGRADQPRVHRPASRRRSAPRKRRREWPVGDGKSPRTRTVCSLRVSRVAPRDSP